jgi:hypothetical protein
MFPLLIIHLSPKNSNISNISEFREFLPKSHLVIFGISMLTLALTRFCCFFRANWAQGVFIEIFAEQRGEKRITGQLEDHRL